MQLSVTENERILLIANAFYLISPVQRQNYHALCTSLSLKDSNLIMPDCLAGSVLISDWSCPILFTEFDSNAGESSQGYRSSAVPLPYPVVFTPGQVFSSSVLY